MTDLAWAVLWGLAFIGVATIAEEAWNAVHAWRGGCEWDGVAELDETRRELRVNSRVKSHDEWTGPRSVPGRRR